MKNILVTGGSNGIGRAIAIKFAEADCRVVVVDVDEQRGRELAGLYDGIVFYSLDVADAPAIESLMSDLSAHDLCPDVLVNNVGVSIFKPLLELTWQEWDQILNVNLRSAFLFSQAFVRHRPSTHSGRIINIASTRHLMSEPHGEAYAASKGGLVSLTHALAVSLSNTRITVNCISPGWIHTGSVDELSAVDHAQHPAGRVGQPSDVADLCLYLAREESGFITGQNFYVDGGMTKKMIYE